MNKKIIRIAALLIVSLILIVAIIYRFVIPNIQNVSTVSQTQIKTQATVTFLIDNGTSIATYDGVLASTVFEALQEVGKKYSIPIDKKQYDFGVFIEKIGYLTNSKENAWIYYVNGTSGEVAADKKMLKDGDVVEWRYTEPTY